MLKEEQKKEVKSNSKGWVIYICILIIFTKAFLKFPTIEWVMEEELVQVTMKLSEYKGRHV